MRNLTLMTDLYQLTMMQGYFDAGNSSNTAVFDCFFRDNGVVNYAVTAGLEQACDYIKNINFSDEDIAYLKSLKIFSAEFLKYLKNFRFSGDIYAMPEGSVVFPSEPIVIVKAPVIEAQLLETALLNIINHQTLIASKAARIVISAEGSGVVEFGLRRAQGPDAGIYGSRAALIGGCGGTSNVLAARLFHLPVKGTHAHSWVMSFKTELEAFEKFAETYPDQCLLLVDTYNTLKSGVPNAIKVFDKLVEKGHKPVGIRLDSGDLAYLSKKAREMLDAAGHKDAIIFASGDIDENVIAHLKLQGAKIDFYGVGTKLITSENMPSLGGVYKMSAFMEDGELKPKMKVSDNLSKATLPAFKTVYRIYDKSTGMAFADLLTIRGEELPKPLTLTHPVERWKQTVLEDYDCRELLVPVFSNGKLVYKFPEVSEIAAYAAKELGTFWNEYKRLVHPHIYKVDLSDKLYELRQSFLQTLRV